MMEAHYRKLDISKTRLDDLRREAERERLVALLPQQAGLMRRAMAHLGAVMVAVGTRLQRWSKPETSFKRRAYSLERG